MARLLLIGIGAVAAVACTDLSTRYRDEPLVAKVHAGMSRDEVRSLAGAPLGSSPRETAPGSCDDYQLRQAGDSSTYYVAFDAGGRVASSGFGNCNGFEHAEYERAHPDHGGY